jgi:uncharacterized repeat protein (TIGR02543 family)
LSFYNYNATVPGHTETLKYGTDISDRSFIPAKPTVLPEGYEFGGWYTTLDTLDDSQFDWTDAEMPAGNLELYAKWSPPVHTVKFFTDEAHSEYDFVVNNKQNMYELERFYRLFYRKNYNKSKNVRDNLAVMLRMWYFLNKREFFNQYYKE